MKDKKIEFEAIIKIKDVYFNSNTSIEKIKKILIYNLEEDAEVEVLDIISIEIKSIS